MISARDKARFMRHVATASEPNACSLWTGAHNENGYGRVWFCGSIMLAHRAAIIVAGREAELLGGGLVLHRCDNPRCVNPKHLFVGSHADNMHDMVAKGRSTHGERHGLARLTAADVRSIRALRASGVRNGVVAKRFGISPAHVTGITSGKKWCRLEEKEMREDCRSCGRNR